MVLGGISRADSTAIFEPDLPQGLSTPYASDETPVGTTAEITQTYERETGGEDDSDEEDGVEIIQNPQTKRYVFNYKFRGQYLPVYVVYARNSPNTTYLVYLVPVGGKTKYQCLTTFHPSLVEDQLSFSRYVGFTQQESIDVSDFQPKKGHIKQYGKWFAAYR
ncbi:hypothetical protein YK48G_18850 [Lentilactobacillus fungorum]|uniref:Uncharacterized protein n=1 Tax=Lentilactobacillus fungorum TaxID=2201250 RepID=A0ABQ3W0V5_9LACO|nr:hypothetical protein [Lentilactobacillus fungorum]GHP14460.1 hypothetical protein YK48G_18850 [Lentilactobacillus fungorum]